MDMTPEEEKVFDYMVRTDKPLRPGDIAKELGMDSKEVSKIIKSLKNKGVVHSPKRCYYAPKRG